MRPSMTLLLVIPLAACAADARDAAYTVADSAGVAIVVNTAPALAEPVTVVDTVPSLVIGTMTDDPSSCTGCAMRRGSPAGRSSS